MCSSDLIFDGSIKGNIQSKGSLTVGKNADIEGDVTADRVVIEGRVNGNGKFEHCRVAASAQFTGSLSTAALEMEEGASLSGDCRVGKSSG